MTLQELNQHLELREQLDRAYDFRESLMNAAVPGAAKLTGMPRASGVNDKVGDLAVELADIGAKIEYLETEIQKSEEAIATFIAGVDDDQARLAFRLRYIRGLSWKEASGILGKYTTEASIKNSCYRYLSGQSAEE